MRDAPPPTALHPDDYRWLTGPASAQWLARGATAKDSPTTRAKHLRAALTPAQASLVLTQLDLRHRAREKFSAAERMFFTAIGLEQATDEIVARYKAARFAGRERIVDLCTGIGGDLMALARQGPTVGVDRDPACAILAAANARAQPDPPSAVEVHQRDISEGDVLSGDAWHIDPDRRPRGRRTTHADLHEPSAAAIDGLLAANPHAAVKLAPAAQWPEHWSELAEFEWISRARSCRQLVGWFGDLAQARGQRRATLLGPGGETLGTITGAQGVDVPAAPRIERYLFEPDAAVLAAKLSGALAARHNLATITPGIAYWTAERTVDDALLAAFEVEEVLPLDMRRVKALLRERGIGRLEIKVRGVEQDPAELRRRLQPTGEREATLLVTRIAGRVTAIVARRVAGV